MTEQVAVVVTSFNQRLMVASAVESVRAQSLPAVQIVVVDDGSTDAESREVLATLEHEGVRVLRQHNVGVSAARNTGIRAVDTDLVAVLDGDDTFAPTFLEATVNALEEESVVAASSWLQMFGTATGVVRPTGGRVQHFLGRNSCPAPSVFRRGLWDAAGGYAEDLRDGFEDWDFFLRLLTPGGSIHIVEKPLINYRTTPGSANLESMNRRLQLYGEIIDRHGAVFAEHLRDALIAQEAISIERLNRWERLVASDASLDTGEITFGDGGMAAHVRIATARGSGER